MLLAIAGHRIGADDIDTMRQRIDRSIQLGIDVRSLPLENGDRPDSDFIPYRGDSKMSAVSGGFESIAELGRRIRSGEVSPDSAG